MTLSVLIDNLPSIIASFPGIDLVYLFGSRVTGQIGPMSDYDLSILDGSGQDPLEIQTQFQLVISKLLEAEQVDVVLINRAPIELAYQIISCGKLLYQRDLYTRVEFESLVLGKYGDYLPTLRLFQQQTFNGDAHAKRVQWYREAFKRTQRTLSQARTFSRSSSR